MVEIGRCKLLQIRNTVHWWWSNCEKILKKTCY